MEEREIVAQGSELRALSRNSLISGFKLLLAITNYSDRNGSDK